MKFMRILFIGLFILLLPGWAFGATYYVAQSGNGDADGTTYLKRASVDYHNAGSGVFAALDGDTVYLCDTITSRVIPPDSGTSGNVVTYRGDYAGHAGVIDRNGGEGAFWIENEDYITVQDLEVTDFSGDGGVIIYGGCNNIIIKDCEIHDGWHRGIFLSYGPGGDPSYITIGGGSGDGNDMYDLGMDHSAGCDIGMNHGNNIIISHNKLYGSATTGVDGITTEWVDKMLIEYNEIYSHNQIGQRENAIDLKSSTNEVIIRFNEIYDYTNPEEGSIHVQMDSDDVAIYGNRIYDGNVGILIFDGAVGWTANGTHMNNIKIWSNLFYDNSFAGIWVYPGSPAGDSINDLVIYNNVFAENGGTSTVTHGALTILTGTGHVVKNNIFYKNRPGQTDYVQAYYTGTATLDYNQYYWPGQTSLIYSGGSNKNVGATETNGDDGDPGFTNADNNTYTLLGTSDCKGEGVNLDGLAMSLTIQGVKYDMYYQTGLDDSDGAVDFSTSPPTVSMVPRDTWDRGAYVYGDGGDNQAPDGTIDTPASSPTTVEIDDEVTLEGSYTDPEDDTCTYAWVIEAETFEEYSGGVAYTTGDLVEDPDAGDSGDFFKCNHAADCEDDEPPSGNWLNAETQADPGTGVCDTAGVYSISLTVSDDAPLADPTAASRTITVNAGGGSAATEEVWGQNTGDDYGTDTITYINADEGVCEQSEVITDDTYDADVGRYGAYYRGSAIVKSGGYPDTCQIKLKLKKTGTLTDRTFTIYEAELSGSDLTNITEVAGMDATLIAESATVYTFECSHNLTEGNMLVVGVTGSVSGSNYISFSADTDSNANLGDQIWYNSDGSYGGAVGNYDFYIEIWEGGAALDDTNYGSGTTVYAKKISEGGTDNQKIVYSVDLTALSTETVNDAKLELWLNTTPTANINVEVWSGVDVSTETGATWSCAVDDNNDGACDTAWTGTHGQTTFLVEVAFTDGSSTGQYYTFTSEGFVSAVGTVATAGGVLRLILISDTNDTSAIAFVSDDGTDEHRPKLTIEYGAVAASVPEVVSVTCSTADGEYNDGDSIGPFQVTFSEPVDVTGTPQMTLELGATDAVVDYASGTGTSTLTFAAFTVAAVSSHTSADLDATQLDLNTGSIASTDDATVVADTADILDTFPTGATVGSLAYNTDITIDVTAPETAAVYGYDVTYCTTCTKDGTYTTAGQMILWAVRFGETSLNINAAPGYPRIQMDSIHPVDTVYSYAMGLGDTTGTVVMGFPVTYGMRSLDLNFTGDLDLGPGGTITDEAGNPVATSMGVLDLSGVASVVLAVADVWPLNSSSDFIDWDTFDTATWSVPGDQFVVSFTGDLNADESGTKICPITITGTVDGDVTFDEDYWSITDLDVTGAFKMSGEHITVE